MEGLCSIDWARSQSPPPPKPALHLMLSERRRKGRNGGGVWGIGVEGGGASSPTPVALVSPGRTCARVPDPAHRRGGNPKTADGTRRKKRVFGVSFVLCSLANAETFLSPFGASQSRGRRVSVAITPQAIQGSSTPLRLPCSQIKGSGGGSGGGSIRLRHGLVECEPGAIFEGGWRRWIGADISSPSPNKRPSNTCDCRRPARWR